MNFGKMMKQAQQMQQQMADVQATLAKTEKEGQAGGGLVRITLTGKHDMCHIKIDPSLLDPAEGEMLEDMIKAAYQDAQTQVEAYSQEAMQAVTNGMDMPAGMKLPF